MNNQHSIQSPGGKSHPKFIAFGNVLLDISVKIDTTDLLKEFGFNSSELGECSEEKLTNILQIVRNRYSHICKNPGGSALNTCRILRSLGETSLCFCGCIGNDENGQIIKNILNENDIPSCLQINESHATGTCICIRYKEDRCCFANIGASKMFTKAFLEREVINRISGTTSNTNRNNCTTSITITNGDLNDKNEINVYRNRINQIFYIESFFTTEKRMEICKIIINTLCGGGGDGDDCGNENISNNILAVNLSAGYMIKESFENIKYLAEISNILFGNLDEFDLLAEMYAFPNFTSSSDQSNALTSKLFACKMNQLKIIVITDGNRPVILHYKDSMNNIDFKKIPIENTLTSEMIVDTTGAGDAFVAGFLYNFLRKKSLELCVDKGVKTAALKITTVGGQLPISHTNNIID